MMAAVTMRIVGVLALILVLAFSPAAAWAAPKVLLFSHTTGYRHASIEPGVAAIRDLAEREGFTLVASEDPAVFEGDGLDGFAAIILLNTTTDRKDPASEWLVGLRRTGLQTFVRGGGGVVGIHATADSHAHWPWYRRMIGGRFARHPEGTPTADLHRTDADHPAARVLPESFRRTDEYYLFEDFDPTITLLATFYPASIGEAAVNPKPVAWAHRFEGGRVFYTAMGHTPESYSEPLFLAHLAAGLRWAAGLSQPAAKGVVIDERQVVRQEPPPHGAIGMSTAYRISDAAPRRTMEFRKRVLHPGAAIGVHPINHDEVYYVLSGEGELESDGKTRRLGPGMAAYLYADAEVGIRQVGPEPLELIISYPLPARTAD